MLHIALGLNLFCAILEDVSRHEAIGSCSKFLCKCCYSLDMIPKPNNVAVTNITSTTATLSWELIPQNEETYGNIHGYKVTVRLGSLVNTTTVTQMTSMDIRNISSNSTYCFHVTAFNDFGDGVPSDLECFTTLGKYYSPIRIYPFTKKIVSWNIAVNVNVRGHLFVRAFVIV